ncbi:MAG: glycosyltransferase [Candidatus Saccharibacteria bacterium]|nr:glycosyltransferase [Candidatus Saccharibacteria bacterium]
MRGLVTVIVPAYNVEKYLPSCIKSIIEQTYNNIEIIIVDDGSSDHSHEVAVRLSRDYKNITVITQTNKGVSEARNNGLDGAHGKYVLFVDADDTIEPTFIEKQVKALENYDIAIVGMNIITKAKKQKLPKHKSEKNAMGALFFDEGVGGYVWNKMYRKEIITNNNLKFDKKYEILEDLIFNINYFKNIKTVKIIREPLYNYYQRKGSVTRKSLKSLTEGMLRPLYYLKQVVPTNLKKNVDYSIIEIKIKGGRTLSLREYGLLLQYMFDFNYSIQRKIKTLAKKIIGKAYRKKWNA